MNSFFFFLSELIVNRILIVSIVVSKIFSILNTREMAKRDNNYFRSIFLFSIVFLSYF